MGFILRILWNFTGFFLGAFCMWGIVLLTPPPQMSYWRLQININKDGNLIAVKAHYMVDSPEEFKSETCQKSYVVCHYHLTNK